MNQWDIEQKFSEKLLLSKIKIIAEESEELLNLIQQKIEQWIHDYEQGKYGNTYTSKNQRIENVKRKLDELPIHIVFSLIVLGECNLQAIATKVGLLCEEDNISACKTGAEILAILDGLTHQIIRPKVMSGETYTVVPLINLDDEEITLSAKLLMFLPPMTTIPNVWTNHYDGGYELVKSSCLLGDRCNEHDKDLNLTVLNHLQRVKYVLDPTITKYNDTCDLSEIKNKRDRELAEHNFNLMLKENRAVYDMYENIPFHFVFKYDKRGRVYSLGYHINIQGNEYRKAMLKFAKYETLTDRGWYWLKVDLANHYGLDKETFETRVQFIDNNIEDMLANTAYWVEKASDKLLFESALESYRQSLITGKSNQIVRLDATTSGPQLMSTIMRDEKAMNTLNVLGNTERHDYYTEVAKKTYELTKASNIWGENPNWKDIRELTKKSSMTYWYNSEAKPREIFGDNTPELKAYYSVLKDTTEGAVILKEQINKCWNDKTLNHSWTMPDGHYVKCPVKITKKSKIEVKEFSFGTGVFTYTSKINSPGHEEWRSLCANVVHSLDAWVCRQVVSNLADLGIEVSPIHDSFGVHANHCDTLRTSYRGCLSRLYRESIIDDIISEILGEDVVIERPKYDKTIDAAIRANVDGYYIC